MKPENGKLKMEKVADRKEAFRQRTKKFASGVICAHGHNFCRVRNATYAAPYQSRPGFFPGDWAANYREASRARSNAEFVSKIEICAQEADESILWMELLRDDCGIVSERLNWLLDESNQLMSIFVTMSKNVKRK